MTVRLVTGDDAILVGDAITTIVNDLVGDGDRSLMVEMVTEIELRNDDGWDSARLVDAVQTPPFLTERRVVIGRHLGRLSRKEQYGPLVSIIEAGTDTTDLVLVWERGVDPKMDRLGAVPKALKEAVEAAGGTVISPVPGRGKAADGWLRDQLSASTLQFDRPAEKAVADLLGEDRSRVVGLLRTLEGALGEAASVTADNVVAFGGDAGSVVPWELDDAIDGGDIAGALAVLHRLLPSRHPFQLLATLHGRYSKMLRLDGAGVNDEKAAAALLEMKGSTFPAKKILAQSRKLGSVKLARAIHLLADADMALRGTRDWPPELVLEVLVARLAALSRR